MILGIIGWIVIGSIVGFIASKVAHLRGDDPRLGIGVAIIAAIVAGFLSSIISKAGIIAWNPWGLLFATAGAVVGVLVWHKVRSRYASHERYVPRSSY